MELNKHIKLMYKIPVENVFLRKLKFDGKCCYFKNSFEFCLYVEIARNSFTMHNLCVAGEGKVNNDFLTEI